MDLTLILASTMVGTAVPVVHVKPNGMASARCMSGPVDIDYTQEDFTQNGQQRRTVLLSFHYQTLKTLRPTVTGHLET